MIVLGLFINFINEVLGFKILGTSIIVYLVSIAIIIFIFKLIGNIGNSR